MSQECLAEYNVTPDVPASTAEERLDSSESSLLSLRNKLLKMKVSHVVFVVFGLRCLESLAS